MSDNFRYHNQMLSREAIDDEDFGNAKLFEDRYELYVNNEFVGYKTLLNQNDDLKDINDFLNTQGFRQFSSQLDGDHYHIEAEGDSAAQIKNALNIYCNNR